MFLISLATLFWSIGCASAVNRLVVHPQEDLNAVLHNPGMGWVLYENYPLDQGGSSTLATLPNENFDGVDAVAVMFAWSDVERRSGEMDWTKVDHAYDYWKQRGKEIQLRMSAESLLYWVKANPPGGLGVPQWVLDQLPVNAKQVRTFDGIDYNVVDARDPTYRKYLARFLTGVNAHFDANRPVTLIDLRGFGLWGEWHQGFRYPSLQAKHESLVGVIDLWCAAFPSHKLALSASYDPDAPETLRDGPTDHYDESFTKNFDEYLYYSGFDHALKHPQIAWRRDGAGGAVHPKERKLIEDAHQKGRGPFVSEFVGGYAGAKVGGAKWVEYMVNDALSLHPNYVNLLGWAAGDALAFMKEQPELFNRGLRTMGYRLVPTKVEYPSRLRSGHAESVQTTWINRGVGRVVSEQTVQFSLIDKDGKVVAASGFEKFPSANWIDGIEHNLTARIRFAISQPGDYTLALQLIDTGAQRAVMLPLVSDRTDGVYPIGVIHVD